MIAAIYARKSTEQNGVADEEKSVTRQVEHARAYATRKGWTVADEHIYVDDGISGAEFLHRDGLTRLLAALKERPPFQVLVMSEQARLGRELYETGYILKRIIDAGVQMFFYLEDREAVISDPVQKMMLQLAGFASEMERHQGRQRTRDAMHRKASRGHVAGGRVFGYRNIRLADHVEREIIPQEAAIIRRIFQEVAEGRGFSRIAKGLNAEGVACPRGRGWAMTGVREMVFRDLYRGRIVWGKTRWVDRHGTKVKQDRPESEWLVVEAPQLRIVPEELWRAAHARLDRTRQSYLRRTGGKLWGRPEAGLEARHLLTGFVVCGACGGAMHAIRRTSRRCAPYVYYTCNAWRVDGACTNSLSVPLPDLDAAVLSAIREDMLTPDLVEAIILRAIEIHESAPDAAKDRRDRLATEAERLNTEIARYTDAIGMASDLPPLLDALRTRQRRRADVLAQLEHLDGLARTPRWGDGLRAELHARLTDWTGLLGRQPAAARQVLRKLLVGRLVLTPTATPAGWAYSFSGRASYGRFLEGMAGVAGLVPPG